MHNEDSLESELFGRCVAASFENTSAVSHLEMEGTQADKTVPQRDAPVLLIMVCPAVDHYYSNIQVQRGCCHTATECQPTNQQRHETKTSLMFFRSY